MARKVLAVSLILSAITAHALGMELRASGERNDGPQVSVGGLLFSGVHQIGVDIPLSDQLSIGATAGAGDPENYWIYTDTPTTAVNEFGLRMTQFVTDRTWRHAFAVGMGLKYSHFQIRQNDGSAPGAIVERSANPESSGDWLLAEVRAFYQLRIMQTIALNIGAAGRTPVWENYGYDGDGSRNLRNTQRQVIPMLEASWVF